MPTKIQLRRDTATNWTSTNPILAQGEKGLEIDTGKEKNGDGVTVWNSLNYIDSNFVHLSNIETITGAKTFSADITNNANEYLTNTTNTNLKGIIYKGSLPFLHDFNYGNNGTVTTNGNNIFLGNNAGNLAMGRTATLAYHASVNTAIGYYALNSLTTGYENTMVGSASGRYITTGYENTGFGKGSLTNITTGTLNTAIGLNSGYFITDGSTVNQTSNQSIYLGAVTKALADGDINEIVIGYNATGNGSNTVTIGNTSITLTQLRGDVISGNQSALATTATNGFLCVPTCAGTPTGAVTNYTGKSAMVVDSTNNRVYFRVGSTWKYATLT